MEITTVLFDLDGTLLPMDLDRFIGAYLKDLASYAVSAGYDPKALTEAMWKGTEAMMKNDGTCTNETRFWQVFAQLLGQDKLQDVPLFDRYYKEDFQKLRSVCGFQPAAREIIDLLKAKGLRLILATNPFFPREATYSRIRWAGLQPEDFAYITTYENSCYCKPNPAYFQEIMDSIGILPSECVMIGNDALEDTAASKLGIPVFLLTDCLLNKMNLDYSAYPQGSFAELRAFLERL